MNFLVLLTHFYYTDLNLSEISFLIIYRKFNPLILYHKNTSSNESLAIVLAFSILQNEKYGKTENWIHEKEQGENNRYSKTNFHKASRELKFIRQCQQ